MTDHVSLWDDPTEQQETNQFGQQSSDLQVDTTATTAGEETNPIAAAIAASSWTRDDMQLALQAANLLLLAYFTAMWREQNV